MSSQHFVPASFFFAGECSKFINFSLIRLESEDGMRGQLSRNTLSIEGGNSAEIVVNDLMIPQNLKAGMKTIFSLIVRKEDYRKKREAENPPESKF